MNNIVSYLKWRGDITLDISAFNDVDNLVLAQFSYVDFLGVVPDCGSISLSDAYHQICDSGTFQTQILIPFSIDLLAESAKSARFGNAKLYNCIDKFDEAQNLQFAAVCFELNDDSTYFAYRGTDDSLTGWREDFMLGVSIVPAQNEAREYLQNTIIPGKTYRVGEQSKDGNLAVYASTTIEVDLQSQIITIYNNDGPGLGAELIASSGYANINSKIRRIVPEFSVIGNLFEHNTDAVTIVKSSASGIIQHDSMTWEVKEIGFVTAEAYSDDCIVINEVFDTWIESVDDDERTIFVDNLFTALSAGGAKRMGDIAFRGIDSFETILLAMVNSEKPAKITVLKFLKAAYRRIRRINFAETIRDSGVLRGAFLALLGLFFMEVPNQALVVSATTAIFACCIFVTRWFVRKLKARKNSKYYALIYIGVIIALSALFFVNHKTIIFSSNFILGVLFVIYGFYRLRKTIASRNEQLSFKILRWAEVVLSFAFGLVALISTGEILGTYVLTVGTFMIFTGLRIIIATLYQLTEK